MATAELEREHDVSYDELQAEVRQLRARQAQFEEALAGPGADVGLATLLAEAMDPQAKSRAASAQRSKAYGARLAAPKEPYRFCGRSAHVRLPPADDANARELRGRGPIIQEAVRGERLVFDPADDPDRMGEEREFRFGDRIDLSVVDREALERCGYLLIPLGSKLEVPDDDHLGGAYMALEQDDYHEACRILRAENAMPRDEDGNILRTKSEVMERLGEWIDDQKG